MRAAARTISVLILGGLLWSGCAGRPSGAAVTMPAVTEGDRTSTKPLDPADCRANLEDPQQQQAQKVALARTLLNSSAPTARGLLIEVLKDSPSASARLAVAQALRLEPTQEPALLTALGEAMAAEDPAISEAAAEALAVSQTPAARKLLQKAAEDPETPVHGRLAAITALAGQVDCRSAGWLVDLLEDDDAAVRQQAALELARMTGLRDFGQDAGRWRAWLSGAREDEVRWLNEQVCLLGQANRELEAQFQQTRLRLIRSATDLYDAAGQDQRPSLIAGYLAESLADLRVVGLRLIDRRSASNEPVGPELTAQAMALLRDPMEAVRAEAALLAGTLAGADALQALLGRLEDEPSPAVRQAVLRSLGQLRQVQALPAVLAQVGSDEPVATAAAAALASIASRTELEPALRAQAVQTLVGRYHRANPRQGVELREAVLIALGVLIDPQSAPVFLEALKDESARIRLAAINGLAALGQPELAAALAPLAGDDDRGVRQAVIAALGALDGQRYLQVILDQTRPEVEPDADVRQQAWDVATANLAEAPAATLEEVVGQLQQRDDSLDQRIQVLGMLVQKRKQQQEPSLAQAQQMLGEALMQAGRPAEAAGVRGEAYSQMDGADARRNRLLLEWIGAMLAADDVAAIAAMADHASGDSLAQSVELLDQRLEELAARQRWDVLVPLCREGLARLADRLQAAPLQRLQQRYADGQQRLREQDHQQVAQLAPQLWNDDPQVRLAARDQLVRMAGRAVDPLLSQLKQTLTGPQSAGPQERALVEVLRQIDPRLATYDPATPLADKLKLIDSLLAPTPQP